MFLLTRSKHYATIVRANSQGEDASDDREAQNSIPAAVLLFFETAPAEAAHVSHGFRVVHRPFDGGHDRLGTLRIPLAEKRGDPGGRDAPHQDRSRPLRLRGRDLRDERRPIRVDGALVLPAGILRGRVRPRPGERRVSGDRRRAERPVSLGRPPFRWGDRGARIPLLLCGLAGGGDGKRTLVHRVAHDLFSPHRLGDLRIERSRGLLCLRHRENRRRHRQRDRGDHEIRHLHRRKIQFRPERRHDRRPGVPAVQDSGHGFSNPPALSREQDEIWTDARKIRAVHQYPPPFGSGELRRHADHDPASARRRRGRHDPRDVHDRMDCGKRAGIRDPRSHRSGKAGPLRGVGGADLSDHPDLLAAGGALLRPALQCLHLGLQPVHGGRGVRLRPALAESLQMRGAVLRPRDSVHLSRDRRADEGGSLCADLRVVARTDALRQKIQPGPRTGEGQGRKTRAAPDRPADPRGGRSRSDLRRPLLHPRLLPAGRRIAIPRFDGKAPGDPVRGGIRHGGLRSDRVGRLFRIRRADPAFPPGRGPRGGRSEGVRHAHVRRRSHRLSARGSFRASPRGFRARMELQADGGRG